MELAELQIDDSWTLFLDRDGVINRKIENDYVRKWEDFEFLPGVLDSLSILSALFGRIVVVTNQRGIGRGLYSIADVHKIHRHMLDEVLNANGRIDGIYFCPHLGTEPECDCRKPKPGMAHQAKTQFPEIDFERSLLVGDSISDILFGESMGMRTALITTSEPVAKADFYFRSLADFTSAFVQ